VILFAAGNLLYRVSANGGSPQAVTALDLSRREMSHGWPYFLPDGNHFLFTVAAATSEAAGIYIGSVDSKARTRILNNRSTAAYAANRNRGEVVFVRDNMLMALPFDAHRMAAAGEPQAVRYAENIEGNRGGAFSVSSTGVLAYRARENRSSRLVWMDRLGKILGMVGEPGEFHGFSLSPDGKFAAVSRGERNASADLWLLDLNRETLSRFTFDPAADFAPLWSPDGSRVVFLSNRNGRRGIYQKPVTGGTAEESLLHVPLHEIVSIDSWSADGRFISFTQRGDKGKTEIGILPVVRDRKPFPALQSDFDTKQGRISPDGRWIAYVSNESGRDEVFVQTFPGPGGKWQISNGGGDTPKWARNGRELFYISPDEMLMTVPVSANAGAFEPGIPGPLFRVAKQDYDVSQDSQRFMLAQPEGSSPSPIQVVIGWNHEH
jgi:Tol biopolymer transport system component